MSDPSANGNIFANYTSGGTAAPGSVQAAAGTATAASPAGTVLSPGLPGSPYEYQYAIGATVVLGQDFADMLGLPANTPVSGTQILQNYYDLSSQQQTIVDDYLWRGGFYTDTSGEPLETRPDFGTASQYNQLAVLNAVLATSNAAAKNPTGNVTLTSLVTQQIQSGAGAALLQEAPSPVTGGGQTYQVRTTSPQDLYSAAYQAFESAQGRAPTQTELDTFTAGYNASERKYQTAANAQAEAASVAKFKQAEQSRNVQLAYERTPAVSVGPAPSGPFHSASSWASAFLTYAFGAKFATSSNIAFIISWINANGGWQAASQGNNPLGARLAQPGLGTTTPVAAGAGGTEKYASWAQGMNATLSQLMNSPNIVALIVSGNAGSPGGDKAAAAKDLGVWSDGAITSFPTPTPADTKLANTVTAAKPAATSTHAVVGDTQGAAAAASPASPAASPAAAQPTGPLPQSSVDVLKGPTPQDQPSAAIGPPGGLSGSGAPAGINTGTPALPGQVAAQVAGTPTEGAGIAPTPPGNTVPQGQSPAQPVAAAPGAGGLSKPGPAATAPATAPVATQPATTPAADIGAGEGQYTTGDTYLPPTTLNQVTPPSPASAAFTAATTGAEQTPYLANQYLGAFNAVVALIENGAPTGG